MIPWSPLARGLLTRPVVETQETARGKSDTYLPRLYDTPGDVEVVKAVEEVARKRGATMAEVALSWLLSRPGVTSPIVGFTKLHHMDAALNALTLTLSEEEIELLETPYQPHEVKGHTYK